MSLYPVSYTHLHISDDGKYLIMGNGTRAFAVAAEQPEKDNPLRTAETVSYTHLDAGRWFEWRCRFDAGWEPVAD